MNRKETLRRRAEAVRTQGAQYIDFDHNMALREDESRRYVAAQRANDCRPKAVNQ